MKKWICAVALTLSMGCATATFRPYVGEQQNWPSAIGSIVNTRYTLPIFTTLPPVAYDVLGEIRVNSPLYPYPEEGHMPLVVRKALEMGADALVFVQGADYFRVPYGSRTGAGEAGAEAQAPKPTTTQVNRFLPESFRPGVTILAIRWLHGPPPDLAPAIATTESPGEPTAPPPKPVEEKPAPPPVKPSVAPVAKPVPPPPVPAETPLPPAPKRPPTVNFGPRSPGAP